MLTLSLEKARRVLCLGAHSDDIEIGAGGTLLKLITEIPDVVVYLIVVSILIFIGVALLCLTVRLVQLLRD